MSVVVVSHNITRHVAFEDDAPGSFGTIGGGPGAGDSAAGLQYEGGFCATRRINATGSDFGWTYSHSGGFDILADGFQVTLVKQYTALTGLTEAKLRIGDGTNAYHEYLIGDDGTEGDNADFLVAPTGGYILIPIHVALTAWIQRGITGSPDISVAEMWGPTWNVTATTGAGLSGASDAIDLTNDGWFLIGGDSTDPDGNFEFFRDADEGAADATADRAGLVTSKSGILFVYGTLVIGRTDGGTSTLTVFTDQTQTLVFPGGYVDAGFNGIEVDCATADTLINFTAISLLGRGRTNLKRFFDTDVDIDEGTDEIDITAHGFSTGDQVLYDNEGGTENIGPDEVVGESYLVTAGGPQSGAYWYVRKVTDDAIQIHPTAADAFEDTNQEALSASTSGDNENHSLRRTPDTRPDLIVTGAGTDAEFNAVACILDGLRQITLTTVATLDTCVLLACQALTIAGGAIDDCTIDSPTIPEGEAFMTCLTSADLANLNRNAFISGGLGHAIEVTTTGTTVGFVGNTFSGYGPGTTSDAGVPEMTFHTQDDVDPSQEWVTMGSDFFESGDAVYYSNEGGTDNIGLVDGQLYYVYRALDSTFAFMVSRSEALLGSNRIDLSDGASGETHAIYSANAAIHNSTGDTITLQVSAGGTTPSIRNSGGSITITENNVALTLIGMRDNTEVRVYSAGTTIELDGIENATVGGSDDRSVTFSLAASISVDIRFAHGEAADGQHYLVPPSNSILALTWPTVTSELPITQVLDRNFDDPA